MLDLFLSSTRLGDAAGLTHYGVNLLRLPPGVWSSQPASGTDMPRRTSSSFIYVLSGEVVLVTHAGEEVLRAGDCAGFRGGDPDGRCLQNRGTAAQWYWKLARASRANTARILTPI